MKRTVLAGILVVAAAAAVAQEDPFAAPPPDAAPDPFAAAPDPFASSAPAADPFAADTAPAPAAADPFAAQPGTTEPVADPFGTSAPADPFGTTAPAPAADPFGTTAPAADPFSAQPSATTGADPFGTSAAPAAPTADPFGTTSGAASPFGTTDASPSPFGTTGASPSPFGGPSTGTASPFGSTALPSDQVNPNGISQLYDFRYQRVPTWDGREVVTRTRLTREDAIAYDQAKIEEYRNQAIEGNLPGYTPGADPNVWAEWVFFAEQLGLWSEFVNNVILAGSDTTPPAWEMVQWPGQPPETDEPAPGGRGASPGGEFNVYNDSSRSLDSQANDFNPFADFGGGAGGQAGAFPPDAITNQVVTAYADKLDVLRTMEEGQELFMNEFEGRIGERQARRLAYQDWRDDQQRQIQDFVVDWNRRYNGEVAMIGGIRYELYRPGTVPDNVHKDATVIVTDYRLTPYDILNPEDGTLRTPTRR